MAKKKVTKKKVHKVAKTRTKRTLRFDIGDELVLQFEERTMGFVEKMRRFNAELDRDREQLYDAYGIDLVKRRIAIANEDVPRRKYQRRAAVTENGHIATPKRGRNGNLTISALKPHIEEALEKLKSVGKPFTRAKVDEILEAAGIAFDPSYVSIALRNSEQLKVIGKEKAPGQGPPMNVYEFKVG